MGEISQYFLLWTFPDVIARDSGIDRSDLGNAMADREVWSTVVACVRPHESNDDDDDENTFLFSCNNSYFVFCLSCSSHILSKKSNP